MQLSNKTCGHLLEILFHLGPLKAMAITHLSTYGVSCANVNSLMRNQCFI